MVEGWHPLPPPRDGDGSPAGGYVGWVSPLPARWFCGGGALFPDPMCPAGPSGEGWWGPQPINPKTIATHTDHTPPLQDS